MKYSLTAVLHKDRTKTGVMLLHDQDGRLRGAYPCYGKSDNKAAAANGNPDRNPLKPYGDIPAGTYTVRVIGPGLPARTYGTGKRLMLTATGGDAAKALGPALADGTGGRWNILDHGGDLDPRGQFRPTHGCLRQRDEDLAVICETIGSDEVPLEIIELAL